MHIARFIKQKPYEHIEYILHRHPLTFLPQIFLFLLLCSVPLMVGYMIQSFAPGLLASQSTYALLVLFVSVYLLGVLLFLYTEFVLYYLDVWIVTNDRVVDIEQLGLFSRTISELDLYNIQDATSDVHGFFPTLFNYGVVTIKTASTNVNIIFRDIPHANKVREDLIRLADMDRRYHEKMKDQKHLT